MGRPKKARPDYRFHSSVQAVVMLGAREFYLGTYDSPKSHARYLELLSIYNANGLGEGALGTEHLRGLRLPFKSSSIVS